MKNNSIKFDIRLATQKDIPGLLRLLQYILSLHSNGRPDIFNNAGSKYGQSELETIVKDKNTPIFVAVDCDAESGAPNSILGYAFCIEKEIKNNRVLKERKILYLDDLCVDESCRGLGLGSKLMEAVSDYAKSISADSIELNVWGFNDSAISFYEHMGYKVQKSTMEYKL